MFTSVKRHDTDSTSPASKRQNKKRGKHDRKIQHPEEQTYLTNKLNARIQKKLFHSECNANI